MADLFGSKASNRGFIIYADENKGIFSDALDLWCRKLGDLTADDFKAGMEGLEKKAEDAYRNGEEMWPPSYAEFRALCFPKSDRDTLAHKPFEKVLAIEDQTAKQKRVEIGLKHTEELLNLLDPKPEPKELTEAEKLDLERLERIKKS
jgi:hypothetical protein